MQYTRFVPAITYCYNDIFKYNNNVDYTLILMRTRLIK